MQIFHHGAVKGVTGSCHQLSLNDGQAILIDCGLFQGAEVSGQGTEHGQQAINFTVESIKALIVTHVHIDHVGRIPYLLAAGFKGPIICTQASAHLLPLVIEDALKVGFTRNKQLIKRVMRRLTQQIIPLPYKQWFSVLSNQQGASLKIKFQMAGHILGSAYVECDVFEPQFKAERRRVIFSGDLGAPYTPLLPAPQSPYGCDELIIESTYGDRQHAGRKQRRQQLKHVLNKALSDNGVVLIPAFSIGRTQELLYEIEELLHRNALITTAKREPQIIVDSPLAAEFTQSYQQLQQHWDKEARNKTVRGRHPLSFESLYTVNSHEEHQQTVAYLQQRQQPCIIIAASGMCAGGRIVNYLKALIHQPQTDIVLVGYQAEGTLGRAIQAHGPKGGYVMLDGERYTINAGIHTLSGYSAHADQKDLINFVKRMRKKPKIIRIVHGSNGAKQALANALKPVVPNASIHVAQ